MRSRRCKDYINNFAHLLIQRTAKINVPKEAKIGGYSSHHFQRLQESAKIRVNECKYTKNWKNVFADVCIFYF